MPHVGDKALFTVIAGGTVTDHGTMRCSVDRGIEEQQIAVF